MRSVVIPLVAAIVFALAGEAFWLAGHADRRVADVHLQLATLQYASAGREGQQVSDSLGLERRVPVVGPQAVADVRDVTATAKYWLTDFEGIAPQKDAAGGLIETDPEILLLAANASFRASQAAGDRLDTIRRLEIAIKNYTDVLKSPAPQADASFNYEYAVRLRDQMAKAPRAPMKPAQAAAANADADLPAGPTIHGHPGGPPQKTDMSQFKIVIPKRGEERKDNPEAGKGGTKVRKG